MLERRHGGLVNDNKRNLSKQNVLCDVPMALEVCRTLGRYAKTYDTSGIAGAYAGQTFSHIKILESIEL